MDAMMMAALGGLAAVSGVASTMMAAGKRRRRWVWGSVGLVLNVPGMLIVTVLPASSHASRRRAEVLRDHEGQVDRQQGERRAAS